MGQIVEPTASGAGSLSLGGQQNVTEVAWTIVTPADLARFHGPAGYRRVYQQGWIGLGVTPGGGPLVGLLLIMWDRFLDLETKSIRFDAFNLVPADTLYWDIDPGGVMLIEVDW